MGNRLPPSKPRTRRDRLLSLGIEPRRFNRVRWLVKMKNLRQYNVPLGENLGYMLADCEIDNFTYELDNEDELADWLAATFGADRALVAKLLLEARTNQCIYEPLLRATGRRWSMKTGPPLGRRLGWYVIARLLRPARIIETGIHDGLGSLVLLAALDVNAHEGEPGDLVSFDIDENAGWIVGQHPRWSRRIEDTRAGLVSALTETPVGMFLHDSLHTEAHERFELTAAAEHMAAGAIMSDNSHVTSVLEQVCADTGRRYSFFRESPRDHFYPGAGIGVGVVK